jgi:purine nucleosidase
MKRAGAAVAAVILLTSVLSAKRLVLIDQDGAGPGGSDQMSMMVLLQSPEVEVLGITIVTGDQWRDEEVQHTLRMLEIMRRTDVPVVPGAVFPLVRTQEETRLAAQLYGTADWLGAWGSRPGHPAHGPYEVPPLPEGAPHTKPLNEDAAHFLIRQIRAHPHEVTLYTAGPLTNIALALSIDPQFAELTKGIVMMGGAINAHNDDPEFATRPTHEFNFWFDPEATHIVLRAHWPRVDITTVDVSFRAPFSRQILEQISKSLNPAAQYIARYSEPQSYLWDELAACAWLDPGIITREQTLYADVDLGHGASYGETITWDEKKKPVINVRLVHVQMNLDLARLTKLFVELMTTPTPRPPSH